MNGNIEESHVVYKSKWIEVYEDIISLDNNAESSGSAKYKEQTKIYNRIKMPTDTATVIPVFEDDSVLMIKAYRRGVNSSILELPGGLIDNNEHPNETAKRELQQETGYSCKTLEARGWFYVWPSKVNQKNYVFLAKELEKVSGQMLEVAESAKVQIITKQELLRKLKNREIQSSETVAALYYGYIVI